MKRYILFLTVAFITLSISSLFAINYFYSNSNKGNQGTKFKMSQVNGKWQLIAVKELLPHKKELAEEKSDKAPRKPFCNDKRILPVWSFILKDISARGQGEVLLRQPNCSKLLEVSEVDLNNDGSKEILLRGNHDFCLWNANCAFWIFGSKQDGYKKMLYGNDYMEINEIGKQVKRTKTKDFNDIVLTEHINSSDTAYTTYKFNGTKYAESKCEVEACFGCIGEITEWETVTCSKYNQMP